MSNWYFEHNGSQQGPLSTEELQNKVEAGVVGPETLVWNESMANWEPLRSALPELAAMATIGAGGAAVSSSENPYQAPQSKTPAGAVYTPDPIESTSSTAMGLGIGSIVGGLCCPIVGLILGIIAIVKSNEVTKALDNHNALGQPYAEKALNNAKTGKITGIVGIVLSVLNGVVGVVLQLGSMV